MRAALFVCGVAIAAGAESHPGMTALITQSLLGLTLIWLAVRESVHPRR